MISLLYLFSLIFSLWKSFQPTQARLYWIACASLIILGTIGAIFAAKYHLASTEMPHLYELGIWAIIIGLGGTVTGIFVIIFRRLSHK